MSDERIRDIERRLEAITPVQEIPDKNTGWTSFAPPDGGAAVRAIYVGNDGCRRTAFIAHCNVGTQPNEANADFIANAPYDIAWLLEQLRGKMYEIPNG